MSEWISVEDKLPSEDRQIEVVFYARPFEWFTGIFSPSNFNDGMGGVFEHHDHQGDDMYHEVKDVTHWMPLPEPPTAAEPPKDKVDG
jgi:hypothetical protein